MEVMVGGKGKMRSQCEASAAEGARGSLIGDVWRKLLVDWRLPFPEPSSLCVAQGTPGILCTALAPSF